MTGQWRRLGLGVLLAVGIVGGGIALGRVVPAPLLAVYNPSPSMPVGWYVRVPLEPAAGRIVVVAPPDGAVAAGWPADVRLIKPVAAVGGDHVCADGAQVLVNSVRVAERGTAPHAWAGCRPLESGELFLIAPARPDSLDSRVFGPVPAASVVGVFAPLWTEGAP